MTAALLILSALCNAALAYAVHHWHQRAVACETVVGDTARQWFAKGAEAGQAQFRAGAVTVEGGTFAVNRLDSGALHLRALNEADPGQRPLDVILPRDVARGLSLMLKERLMEGAKGEGVAGG